MSAWPSPVKSAAPATRQSVSLDEGSGPALVRANVFIDPDAVVAGERVAPEDVGLAVAGEVDGGLHLPVAVDLAADAVLRGEGGAVHQPHAVASGGLVAPQDVGLAVAVEVGAHGGGQRKGRGPSRERLAPPEGVVLRSCATSSRDSGRIVRGAEPTSEAGRTMCAPSQADARNRVRRRGVETFRTPRRFPMKRTLCLIVLVATALGHQGIARVGAAGSDRCAAPAADPVDALVRRRFPGGVRGMHRRGSVAAGGQTGRRAGLDADEAVRRGRARNGNGGNRCRS